MVYLCIDLKCFYASVECVERNLNPFSTPLVVSDPSRGRGALCLAVSPKMKELGVKNRCRLFEIPDSINYIIAKPRMKKYIEYASRIYEIYLKYVSKEDIHVYSIDEAFLDITHYLKLYQMTPYQIGKMICQDILSETKITSSCGIGTNLFLTKVALDIEAKKNAEHIAFLDEELFKEKLWEHKPLTDFFQIAKGISRRLNKIGLYTLKDIAHCDEEKLYKEFGVNAKELIDHSWGRDDVTIREITSYIPKSKSISSGQVLEQDYSKKEAMTILKEMVELLTLDLVRKHLVASNISLYVGYSNTLNVKGVSCSRKIGVNTSSLQIFMKEFKELFDKKVQDLPIRRISISYGNLNEESIDSFPLFMYQDSIKKEKELHRSIIDIKERFGNNSIIRGMNLEEGATTIKRNRLIGGHNSE